MDKQNVRLQPVVALKNMEAPFDSKNFEKQKLKPLT
jgi:hypothetical protein